MSPTPPDGAPNRQHGHIQILRCPLVGLEFEILGFALFSVAGINCYLLPVTYQYTVVVRV